MLFINKSFNSIACLLSFTNLQLVIPGRTWILLYLGRTMYKRLWACLALYMVRFHVRAMHWCMRCHTQLGSTPILCDCDVWFQCKYIGNHIQTLCTLWTKSLNHKQHSISWYNKSQSRIAPCERAFTSLCVNRSWKQICQWHLFTFAFLQYEISPNRFKALGIQ